MPAARSPRQLRYVAKIDNVGEIALHGTADHRFWADRLRHEGLVPLEKNGRAKLLISATVAKFKGIRFRELCFLIEAFYEKDGEQMPGVFLIQAFNSVRFFAWVERTFFSCPYAPAQVAATLGPRTSLGLHDRGTCYLAAEVAPNVIGTPAPEDGWQGPVFLPQGKRQPFFYARLSGTTESFLCKPNERVKLQHHPRYPIFACLVESGFQATEWRIRRSARHAKSETLDRQECSLQLLTTEQRRSV